MIHSPPPCCRWALSLTGPSLFMPVNSTWGQSADSISRHPRHSRPLTYYKRGCLPGQRFPCCLTARRHKKPPGPVDTGIKKDNEGTDWEAPLENNTSCCCMDIQYWQITIYVLPEWLPNHVKNFNSDKLLD